MAKSYSEKLQDEKWQKIRRRILRRDEHKCVSCGATDLILDVHHGYYGKNMEPWEYPEETLHTLCRICHENAEHLRLQVYRELALWQPLALKGLLFYLYNARDINAQVGNIKNKHGYLDDFGKTEFGEEVNNG